MAKIKGIVRIDPKERGRSKYIRIYNGKEEVQVIYNNYIWLKNGDKIKAKYDEDSWECTEHPLVSINMDVEKISSEFAYHFNLSFGRVNSLMAHIKDNFECEYNQIGDTLCILSDEYSFNRYISKRLLTFKGISRTAWGLFFVYWYKNYSLRRVYNHNINYTTIEDSMMRPSEIYDAISTNPLTIIGIPYEKSKAICKLVGIDITKGMIACNTFMLGLYDKLSKYKWTCVIDNRTQIDNKTIKKYNVIYDELFKCYYLRPVYEKETKLASMIISLVSGNNRLNIKCENTDITGNQLKAVDCALSNNVFIIGGSAGTGKSTIIKIIADCLKANKYQFLLTSFTGIATDVLRKKTGYPAYTFHSLFLNNKVDIDKYQKDGKFHIIIDEFSTVYTELLYKLLSMYKSILGQLPTITFVGDINQTIPIKYGNPFYEMLRCECIPRIFLNKNYRLKISGSEVNSIMINSECIARNIKIDDDFYTDKFFRIVESTDVTKVIKIVSTFGNKDIKRFIVLCPYVKDVNIINKEVQNLFNVGNKRKKDSGGNIWVVGDRVVVTKNNTHYDIANGQRGIILDIKSDQIIVALDERSEKFFFTITGKTHRAERNKEDDEEVSSRILYSHNLDLGYAITVNKSQGTQCEVVIGFVSKSVCTSFLDKNLLYTLITRAEKVVIIVGMRSVLAEMKYRERSKVLENLGNRIALKLDKIEEIEQEPNTDFENAMELAGLNYGEAQISHYEEAIFVEYDY